MKIYSFIRQGLGLRPVEVEISLIPGVPQIQFLGLPDPLIKESVLRIKAALRQQGFELPPTKQILVHLKPSYIKKTSRGLDLAVAAGILWETEQIPIPQSKAICLYGELSLRGDVIAPDDVEEITELPADLYLGERHESLPLKYYKIQSLSDLKKSDRTCVEPDISGISIPRPELVTEALIGKSQAEIIQTIAVGEHPTLFAGPAGSGKSSSVSWITHLLGTPSIEEFLATKRIARFFGEKPKWRPVVAPHHSASHLAIIGGGVPPLPGEITRAHGGCLILDELLEFSSKVQESLREPAEKGFISLARGQKREEFPARFLLLATTNLCPCGQLVPSSQNKCRCRPQAQRRYIERLSGPMLDRFSILSFSHEWTEPKRLRVDALVERVDDARVFAKKTRKQNLVNHKEPLPLLEKTLSPFAKKNLFPNLKGGSFRRYESLIRVARSIADLDHSTSIEESHLQKSLDWSVSSFERLQRDLDRFLR